MIVFKYFFKILKKYISTIIMFTAVLIIFGTLSFQSNNDNSGNFTAEKPSICIVNNDKDVGISKSICQYLEKVTNVKDIEDSDEKRSDALFYRDVSYIIYIPQNYSEDFMNGKNVQIEVKGSGNYETTFAQMLLDNYLQTANIYLKSGMNENEIIEKTEQALEENIQVEMTSKIDSDGLAKLAFYYNFANYSILAVCIYVVATIMSSFREEKIKRRTMISPINMSKYNRYIFCGIMILGIAIWALYVLISIFLIKDVMFTTYGLFYAINSFIFTICALSIAFLIGNILKNKEAISGVANVISLGSAFLCGSFVPVDYLPEGVLKFAHILPSYWYIQNNEYLKTVEQFNIDTLMPFIANAGIVILFTLIFIIITNIYTKKKKS